MVELLYCPSPEVSGALGVTKRIVEDWGGVAFCDSFRHGEQVVPRNDGVELIWFIGLLGYCFTLFICYETTFWIFVFIVFWVTFY